MLRIGRQEDHRIRGGNVTTETEKETGKCSTAGFQDGRGRSHEAKTAGSLQKPEKAREEILPYSFQKEGSL